MYLQKVTGKTTSKKIFFVGRRSLRKRPAYGSVSQRSGSPDPDPYKNVTDPEHCPTPLLSFLRWGEEPFFLFAPLLSIIHILHDKLPTSQCTVKHNFVMLSWCRLNKRENCVTACQVYLEKCGDFVKIRNHLSGDEIRRGSENFVTFTNKNASLRPRNRPCRKSNRQCPGPKFRDFKKIHEKVWRFRRFDGNFS